MERTVLVVATGTLALAGAAAGQSTVQQDINDIAYQVKDSTGVDAPWSGAGHTGSVVFGLGPTTVHNAVLVQNAPGDPFVADGGFTGNLTGIAITVVLNAGNVTGGSVMIEVDGGGSVYSSGVSGGFTTALVRGGFTIDMTGAGAGFSSANFAGADVLAWLGNSSTMAGLIFKFNPLASGSGFADLDIFTVPAPSSAAILGIAALALRRRR